MLKHTITVLLIFISCSLTAQPGDPNGDPGVPITGIEILISMGALFGVKKLLGKSKQK